MYTTYLSNDTAGSGLLILIWKIVHYLCVFPSCHDRQRCLLDELVAIAAARLPTHREKRKHRNPRTTAYQMQQRTDFALHHQTLPLAPPISSKQNPATWGCLRLRAGPCFLALLSVSTFKHLPLVHTNPIAFLHLVVQLEDAITQEWEKGKACVESCGYTSMLRAELVRG